MTKPRVRALAIGVRADARPRRLHVAEPGRRHGRRARRAAHGAGATAAARGAPGSAGRPAPAARPAGAKRPRRRPRGSGGRGGSRGQRRAVRPRRRSGGGNVAGSGGAGRGGGTADGGAAAACRRGAAVERRPAQGRGRARLRHGRREPERRADLPERPGRSPPSCTRLRDGHRRLRRVHRRNLQIRPDAVHIVTALLRRRQSCTISARNDVFGDPCNKAVKTLAVEVAVPARPVSTAAPSRHVRHADEVANRPAAEAEGYARDYPSRWTRPVAATLTSHEPYQGDDRHLQSSVTMSLPPTEASTARSASWRQRGYMTLPTSMHEIAHTLGVGSSQFAAMISTTSSPAATPPLNTRDHRHPHRASRRRRHPLLALRPQLRQRVPRPLRRREHCKIVSAIRKDLGMSLPTNPAWRSPTQPLVASSSRKTAPPVPSLHLVRLIGGNPTNRWAEAGSKWKRVFLDGT